MPVSSLTLLLRVHPFEESLFGRTGLTFERGGSGCYFAHLGEGFISLRLSLLLLLLQLHAQRLLRFDLFGGNIAAGLHHLAIVILKTLSELG